MSNQFVLQDLIAESKDGEWGKGEPFDGSVEMVVVRSTDFEDVQFGCPENVPVRSISPAIAARKTLRQDDIIIETAGGGKDRPTGRTQLLRRWFCVRSPLPITCASFCRFLRINEAKADPIYVYWLLQHMYSAGFMKQFHTQHTGVARFQYTTFATTQKFFLPSRAIQCKIASILSAYDDLIENNTRRIAILEAMAQAIYREWFVEFRFPGHEKIKLIKSPLGKIPEGWKVGRLDDVLVLQRGFDLPIGQREEGEVPVYAAAGVVGAHSQVKVKGPGVLTGRSGSLGTVLYVHEDYWPLNTALWVKEFRKPSAIFAYYTLSSIDFTSFNSGAAVPTLNRNDIHGLRTILPPDYVVYKFHDLQEPFFVNVRLLREKNGLLRKTRDLLLPKLISGQLDVEDLDIEFGETQVEVEA
jgi:type I restriction enzyme S subunit